MQKHLQNFFAVFAMMVIPWVAQGQAFSYTCNFDNDSDTTGWVLLNGSQTNKWFIDTATHNSGTKSLYISSDNGMSNTYDARSVSFVYAYHELVLVDTGYYSISYDWKCYGESNYDYIRVFLAPASATLTAGQIPTGGINSLDWSSAALPSGFISLTDTATKLNLQSSWQSLHTIFKISSAHTYLLVFAWANDILSGTQPPAAIDNIQFEYIGCLPVENLSATNVTQSSADITWIDTFNTASWTVEYGVSGFTVGTGTSIVVYDTATTLTGLTPNTSYDVYVSPVCLTYDTMPAFFSFHTACALIDSLPWYDDFESYSTGYNVDFMPCYHRLNNGTEGFYPYLNNTSGNHTPGGTRYLYWHINSRNIPTYGRYQCAVLPGIDTTIDANALQLNFWAKVTSYSGTPLFKVGVMTDPDDISTFMTVGTVTLTGSDWQEVSVPLSAYTGNGHYVAIKTDAVLLTDDYWGVQIDDITLDYITTCHVPEVVYSIGATDTSITLEWIDIDSAMAWRVEYGPHGYTSESSLITTAHPVTINGLSPLTQYDFYVLPICAEGDTARWPRWWYPTTLSTIMCEDSLIVATGDDSSSGTSYKYPVNNWYNYALTETIIDSAELGGAMNIEYISYYYDYATAMTRKNNCTIYFQPTTLSTFNSWMDVIVLDTNTAVMVYTGPLNCSQGWNYFTLDNAYYYDGTGSLLVIVDDNSGIWSFHDTRYVFKTHPCKDNKTFYCYSDGYDPDVMNPSLPSLIAEHSVSRGIDSSRVVMQLLTCLPPVCDAPTDIYTVADSNSVTVGWTAGDGNNSFELEYGPHGFSHGTGTIDTATSSPVTISNLDYATEYDIYVRALCSHDIYSEWSDVASFTTDALGIDRVGAANCTIYPNPCRRSQPNGSNAPLVTISVSGVSGMVQVEVVDIKGHKVICEHFECSADCKRSLGIKDLPSGIYMVRVTSESNILMVKKLIVQ